MFSKNMSLSNSRFRDLVAQYLKASKKVKGSLLDELCRKSGQNRKYLIRKIKALSQNGKKLRKQKKLTYGPEVRDALYRLWELFEYPCGQRLKPLLENEIDRLKGFQELRISPLLAEKLKTISSSTIDRLLSSKKKDLKRTKKTLKYRNHLLTPRPPSDYAKQKIIPSKNLSWNFLLPFNISSVSSDIGNLPSLKQTTSCTKLQNITKGCHLPSGWRITNGYQKPSSCVECLPDTKSRHVDATLKAERNNPHLNPTISLDEMLFPKKHQQKNGSYTNNAFSPINFENLKNLLLINNLYQNELLLYKNFFHPVKKLIRKESINGKVKKFYDAAKTPYQRLLESGQLCKEMETSLQKLYQSINPLQLKESIERKLVLLSALYHKTRLTSAIDSYMKHHDERSSIPEMIQYFKKNNYLNRSLN